MWPKAYGVLVVFRVKLSEVYNVEEKSASEEGSVMDNISQMYEDEAKKKERLVSKTHMSYKLRRLTEREQARAETVPPTERRFSHGDHVCQP